MIFQVIRDHYEIFLELFNSGVISFAFLLSFLPSVHSLLIFKEYL